MEQKVRQAFTEKFGKEPKMFFSPGRINLIGEHVDYNDGFVMPAAIDKGIWFAVAENNTRQINCISYELNETLNISLDEIHPQSHWRNYILGIIHVFQKNNLAVKGFDCVFGGNLPIGSGLSSSAAVECGLAFALNDIFHLQRSRKSLALMSQQAEHLYPGVNCGIMDQYANLMGKADNVILLDCKTIEHNYFPFQLKDHTLVLINSKVHHSLASGEYNKRRSECAEGLSWLQQQSFRDVTPEQLESCKSKMPSTVYARCLYVINEIQRTLIAAELLKENNIEGFGELMYQTHQGLSELYEVSCDELDFLVEQAKQNNVTGSRLMGGGFGGCTINIIPKENHSQAIATITSAYKEKFNIEPGVIEVNIANGTHQLS